MIDLEELKKRVQDVPPLPGVVTRLIEMCRDPEVAPRDIIEVIRHEPGITMKVLRLCNSTFYGLPRKVTSIQEALVYLGADAIVNFVLAGELSGVFRQDVEGYEMERGLLWRHAIGTAICAQKVAERVAPSLAGSAFTAGLLHCVGKMILSAYVADQFFRIQEMVERQGKPFQEAERTVLGYTHAEVGAQIAEHWGLPPEIVACIRYHLSPAEATDHANLVAIVHVGNILCISFGLGVGADGLAYVFHPGAMDLLGLRVEHLFALSVEIHDQFKKAEDLLQL